MQCAKSASFSTPNMGCFDNDMPGMSSIILLWENLISILASFVDAILGIKKLVYFHVAKLTREGYKLKLCSWLQPGGMYFVTILTSVMASRNDARHGIELTKYALIWRHVWRQKAYHIIPTITYTTSACNPSLRAKRSELARASPYVTVLENKIIA